MSRIPEPGWTSGRPRRSGASALAQRASTRPRDPQLLIHVRPLSSSTPIVAEGVPEAAPKRTSFVRSRLSNAYMRTPLDRLHQKMATKRQVTSRGQVSPGTGKQRPRQDGRGSTMPNSKQIEGSPRQPAKSLDKSDPVAADVDCRKDEHGRNVQESGPIPAQTLFHPSEPVETRSETLSAWQRLLPAFQKYESSTGYHNVTDDGDTSDAHETGTDQDTELNEFESVPRIVPGDSDLDRDAALDPNDDSFDDHDVADASEDDDDGAHSIANISAGSDAASNVDGDDAIDPYIVTTDGDELHVSLLDDNSAVEMGLCDITSEDLRHCDIIVCEADQVHVIDTDAKEDQRRPDLQQSRNQGPEVDIGHSDHSFDIVNDALESGSCRTIMRAHPCPNSMEKEATEEHSDFASLNGSCDVLPVDQGQCPHETTYGMASISITIAESRFDNDKASQVDFKMESNWRRGVATSDSSGDDRTCAVRSNLDGDHHLQSSISDGIDSVRDETVALNDTNNDCNEVYTALMEAENSTGDGRPIDDLTCAICPLPATQESGVSDNLLHTHLDCIECRLISGGKRDELSPAHVYDDQHHMDVHLEAAESQHSDDTDPEIEHDTQDGIAFAGTDSKFAEQIRECPTSAVQIQHEDPLFSFGASSTDPDIGMDAAERAGRDPNTSSDFDDCQSDDHDATRLDLHHEVSSAIEKSNLENDANSLNAQFDAVDTNGHDTDSNRNDNIIGFGSVPDPDGSVRPHDAESRRGRESSCHSENRLSDQVPSPSNDAVAHVSEPFDACQDPQTPGDENQALPQDCLPFPDPTPAAFRRLHQDPVSVPETIVYVPPNCSKQPWPSSRLLPSSASFRKSPDPLVDGRPTSFVIGDGSRDLRPSFGDDAVHDSQLHGVILHQDENLQLSDQVRHVRDQIHQALHWVRPDIGRIPRPKAILYRRRYRTRQRQEWQLPIPRQDNDTPAVNVGCDNSNEGERHDHAEQDFNKEGHQIEIHEKTWSRIAKERIDQAAQAIDDRCCRETRCFRCPITFDLGTESGVSTIDVDVQCHVECEDREVQFCIAATCATTQTQMAEYAHESMQTDSKFQQGDQCIQTDSTACCSAEAQCSTTMKLGQTQTGIDVADAAVQCSEQSQPIAAASKSSVNSSFSDLDQHVNQLIRSISPGRSLLNERQKRQYIELIEDPVKGVLVLDDGRPLKNTGPLGPRSLVSLNIGGQRFDVLRSTLSRYPETLLGRIAHSPLPVYIDRSPILFPFVIDTFRTGAAYLPSTNQTIAYLESLRDEARFYQIDQHMFPNGTEALADPRTNPKLCPTKNRGSDEEEGPCNEFELCERCVLVPGMSATFTPRANETLILDTISGRGQLLLDAEHVLRPELNVQGAVVFDSAAFLNSADRATISIETAYPHGASYTFFMLDQQNLTSPSIEKEVNCEFCGLLQRVDPGAGRLPLCSSCHSRLPEDNGQSQADQATSSLYGNGRIEQGNQLTVTMRIICTFDKSCRSKVTTVKKGNVAVLCKSVDGHQRLPERARSPPKKARKSQGFDEKQQLVKQQSTSPTTFHRQVKPSPLPLIRRPPMA